MCVFSVLHYIVTVFSMTRMHLIYRNWSCKVLTEHLYEYLKFTGISTVYLDSYQCLQHVIHTYITFTLFLHIWVTTTSNTSVPPQKKHILKTSDIKQTKTEKLWLFLITCHAVMCQRSWHFVEFSRSSVKGQSITQCVKSINFTMNPRLVGSVLLLFFKPRSK